MCILSKCDSGDNHYGCSCVLSALLKYLPLKSMRVSNIYLSALPWKAIV
jgi:hypothetical protein